MNAQASDKRPDMAATDGWPAPYAHGPIHGRVQVPGSKSEANRALVIAALSDGPSTVSGLPDARDIHLMVAALKSLGVRISQTGEHAVIVQPGTLHAASDIDCGLAGTVMRFVPPLAALAPGTTHFMGDPRASHRPLAPLLDGLEQLGAVVSSRSIPFSLTAPDALPGRTVTIDASASSQFISGLLLAAAAFPRGIELNHRGDTVPSAPHIAMTCAMLARHGVGVEHPSAGQWLVDPGGIHAVDEAIEPDLTNAAVFLSAAVLASGSVTIADWPRRSTQPGALIGAILARMGATFVKGPKGATASVVGNLRGADLDLHETSELTPVVAGLAVAARGVTTIRGVAHIRGHETDRITAIATELGRLGVPVRELADGVVITGMADARKRLHSSDGDGLFRCYADHRMAHLGALMGLIIPGVRLDDVGTTTKTMPDFPGAWSELVGS